MIHSIEVIYIRCPKDALELGSSPYSQRLPRPLVLWLAVPQLLLFAVAGSSSESLSMLCALPLRPLFSLLFLIGFYAKVAFVIARFMRCPTRFLMIAPPFCSCCPISSFMVCSVSG